MIKNNNVSVLIVAYNSGEYIIKTLRSVLAQTYTDIEILILDNNSSDETIKNIEKFDDSRIQLFQGNENIGPYAGLNYLLKKVSGEYIAIQDHDDIWHEEKLTTQIQFLKENSEYIGCGTEAVMYYESDKKYFLYNLKQVNYYTIHPSLVFRNTSNFVYDERLIYFGDAYSQKINLCQNEKKIYTINTPLTLHIIKDGYQNFSYSWFKIQRLYIKRIVDVHNISFYSFLIISYEIFRKGFIKVLGCTKNKKMFLFFDRLPYMLSGNIFYDISKTENNYIKDMRKYIDV